MISKISILSKLKLKELSIKEKIMFIKKRECKEKSQRKLAKIYGEGKTQIQKLITVKKRQMFSQLMRITFQMTERESEYSILRKTSIHQHFGGFKKSGF